MAKATRNGPVIGFRIYTSRIGREDMIDRPETGAMQTEKAAGDYRRHGWYITKYPSCLVTCCIGLIRHIDFPSS